MICTCRHAVVDTRAGNDDDIVILHLHRCRQALPTRGAPPQKCSLDFTHLDRCKIRFNAKQTNLPTSSSSSTSCPLQGGGSFLVRHPENIAEVFQSGGPCQHVHMQEQADSNTTYCAARVILCRTASNSFAHLFRIISRLSGSTLFTRSLNRPLTGR